MASRGGIASSTPPKGSIYRLIDSARFCWGALLPWSPARRISLASASIDLPWLAARSCSFVFTLSSSRRMVILATHL